VHEILLVECWSARHRDIPATPTWVWTTPTGHRIKLCDACSREWLSNSITAPDLTPASIELIPG
jgi:hypothetical protein